MKKLLFVLSVIVAMTMCACAQTHVHTFSDAWDYNETEHYHVADCGHDEFSGNAAHTFGDYKVVTPATCTEQGLKQRECTVCGYKESEDIAAEHHYELMHDEDSHFYKCTECEDVKDDTEHVFEEKELKPATCTEQGLKQKECTECGYKFEEDIPFAHKYEQKYDYAYHYSECSECGAKSEFVAHDGNPCSECDHSVVWSDILLEKNGDDAYLVKGIGDCKDNIINIPAYHDGKPVTAIDGFAFVNGTVTQVNIPATVTSIGIAAFMNCGSLEKINIPRNVTILGGNAFKGCGKLNDIELPDGITEIGGFCFENTGIYNTSSNWSNNVLYIGNYAIKGDEKNFTGALDIREGTSLIATYAFSGCTLMTSVNIPKSVKYIGVGAFSECLKTKTMTVAPENENYYSDGECIIEREEKRIVAGCPSSVIPKDVKIIGESSFSALEIEEITIPVSVVAIEDFAFGFCDKLETFNYEGTLDQWKLIKLGTGWKSDTLSWFTISCTDGYINPFGETRK